MYEMIIPAAPVIILSNNGRPVQMKHSSVDRCVRMCFSYCVPHACGCECDRQGFTVTERPPHTPRETVSLPDRQLIFQVKGCLCVCVRIVHCVGVVWQTEAQCVCGCILIDSGSVLQRQVKVMPWFSCGLFIRDGGRDRQINRGMGGRDQVFLTQPLVNGSFIISDLALECCGGVKS